MTIDDKLWARSPKKKDSNKPTIIEELVDKEKLGFLSEPVDNARKHALAALNQPNDLTRHFLEDDTFTRRLPSAWSYHNKEINGAKAHAEAKDYLDATRRLAQEDWTVLAGINTDSLVCAAEEFEQAILSTWKVERGFTIAMHKDHNPSVKYHVKARVYNEERIVDAEVSQGPFTIAQILGTLEKEAKSQVRFRDRRKINKLVFTTSLGEDNVSSREVQADYFSKEGPRIRIPATFMTNAGMRHLDYDHGNMFYKLYEPEIEGIKASQDALKTQIGPVVGAYIAAQIIKGFAGRINAETRGLDKKEDKLWKELQGIETERKNLQAQGLVGAKLKEMYK